MRKTFESLLHRAAREGWCVTPGCTTCGAMAYRKALSELTGPLGGPLAYALANASPSSIMQFANWPGALEIALRSLPIPDQVSEVLAAWLECGEPDVRFTDVLLFRIVRYMHKDSSLRHAWLERGLALARDTRDSSLIETLLFVAGTEAPMVPGLVELAKEVGATSKQMKRVLRNVCRVSDGGK